MKRVTTAAALIFFLFACGNNQSTTAASPEATQAPPAGEQKLSPEAEKGETLIAQNDCLGCHRIEEAVTGPSYREVAQKYAGQGEAIKDTLAQHIIKGLQPGEGPWGTGQMMTPHPTLSQDDAKAMVTYILSLKQSE